MGKYPFLRWWLNLRGFYDRLFAWAQGEWAKRRSPMFPQFYPEVMTLETRWVPAVLSGITEYTVPTGSANPLNMTLGPDNNVWFTENSAAKIAKITTGGSFTEYALTSGYNMPYDITVGPDGNLWFTETTPAPVGGALGKSTTGGSITDYNFG